MLLDWEDLIPGRFVLISGLNRSISAIYPMSKSGSIEIDISDDPDPGTIVMILAVDFPFILVMLPECFDVNPVYNLDFRQVRFRRAANHYVRMALSGAGLRLCRDRLILDGIAVEPGSPLDRLV